MLKLKIVTLLFSFFSFLFSLDCFAQEKIIAIVNDDVITQKDLDDSLRFIRVQLSQDFKDGQIEDKVQSMKTQILEKLIEDRLILQEAKKNNIRVDENRVKAKVNEIKTRYSTDIEFQKAIASEGLAQADIEKKFREQLLMFSIVEQKVRNKIVISPQEVTSFYEQNKNEFRTQEERLLEIIILESDSLAREFSANLKSGEILADLAARYSVTIDEFTVKEGDELRKDVAEAVFKLTLNEVSEPLEIEGKYYVFRLTNIVPSKQLSLIEAQEEISSFLFESKMRDEMTGWLEELKKKSYLKMM
jgi:parvulin-like peptidyl-prolyl isomerase